MSIIGSFFNFNNIVLNCFKPSTPKRVFSKEVLDTSKRFNITILPIKPHIIIKNLYPTTNMVEKWSTLIVGNDKTYILCNLNEGLKDVVDNKDLLNRQGLNILPNDLNLFLNSIFDMTLKNKKLQFFMIYKNKIYFVNTFPFTDDDDNKDVIGAICFIRAFEGMSHIKFNDQDHFINPQIRQSIDIE